MRTVIVVIAIFGRLPTTADRRSLDDSAPAGSGWRGSAVSRLAVLLEILLVVLLDVLPRAFSACDSVRARPPCVRSRLMMLSIRLGAGDATVPGAMSGLRMFGIGRLL